MITLIVKGGKFSAAQTAARHGVPFVFVREQMHGRETVGKTTDANLDCVTQWFANDEGFIKGTGFPVGTLLFYRS